MHAQTLSPARTHAGELRAVLAASYVSGASLILLNGLPLLLGAADETFRLGPERLGYLGGVAGLSALVVNASIPFWIRRVDWRTATRLLSIAALVILVLGAASRTYATLLATFTFLGISLGLLGAPAFARLGDAAEPRSAFSWSIGVAMGITAIWCFASPAYIQPQFGYRGAVLSLIAIILPCLVLARWLKAPPHRVTEESTLTGPAAEMTLFRHLNPLAGPFVALFLYTSGVTIFYAFLDRLGKHLGVSEGRVGGAVALGSVFSAVAAICSARWGRQVAPFALLLSTTLIMSLCDWTIFSGGSASFVLSVLAWNVAWALSYPQYLALVRREDVTHRLYTLSPAIVSVATFAGSASGGVIIQRVSFAAAIASSAAFVAVALGLSGWVDRRVSSRWARRRQ